MKQEARGRSDGEDEPTEELAQPHEHEEDARIGTPPRVGVPILGHPTCRPIARRLQFPLEDSRRATCEGFRRRREREQEGPGSQAARRGHALHSVPGYSQVVNLPMAQSVPTDPKSVGTRTAASH